MNAPEHGWRFLVLEGLDGAGKSTLAAMLAAETGAVLMQTPAPALQGAREEVRREYGPESPALTLFYASAVLHQSGEVRRRLDAGQRVVMDRYWLSTLAYAHLAGRELSLPAVEAGLSIPDATVFLSVPLEVREARLVARGHLAHHDLAGLELPGSQRLERGYTALARHPLAGRFVVMEAWPGTAQQVCQQILGEVSP